MNKVHFLFGVHNHQPIGNFDFVFEDAYAQSYLPFLEAMERHPKVHWNLHATGILWEWLEKHHPEYLERVAAQVREERVEILTGGYYEPILSALPDADKLGQIAKLTRYIRQKFKVTPRGMWLAERVWEPQLAKCLAEAGVEYTLLDDSHFLSTGLTDSEMSGAYLTEEQGFCVKVLPIRKDLRYAIPFRDSGETLTLLRQFVTPSAHQALTMFDDGEKFGLWPGTQEPVYRDGWLDGFLSVLESNSDWIIPARISDYLDAHVPRGRVYLPTASYEEMGQWALPAAELSSDVANDKNSSRSGYWRNFLTKYEESNNLHKKMLWVAKKVHRAAAAVSAQKQRAGNKVQRMFESLWAGQCNCAYWHGVFGGLYLPHLRQALYRELMKAENLAEELEGRRGNAVYEDDFDKDGAKEILVETPTQNLYFAPHHGGSLFEWDLREKGINMANVLTRRPETYHRRLAKVAGQNAAAATETDTAVAAVRVKEPALDQRLHTDWYRRANLLDHFFHPDTTLDTFSKCQYGEQGDFIKTGYAADVVKEGVVQIRLSRIGHVWTGEQRNRVAIEKTISVNQDTGWQVIYRVQNVQGPAFPLWFGCEMAFAFGATENNDAREHVQALQWQKKDTAFGFQTKLQFDVPTDLWEFPLQTVSLSEGGLERTYQGTILLAQTKLLLQPNQAFVRSWRVQVGG